MTHASLFSGIGGCEVAAAMMGWENAFHCEINPFGRAVLDYWFPKSKSYEDITKTNFEQWRGGVDILTGGFPCQPFSYAGQRRGAEDDRYLWPHMLRAIQEIRPTWVIGENVAGITTMVEPGEIVEVGVQTDLFGAEKSLHTYEYRQRFTLERVCADLEGIGYSVQPVLVPACAVGAPHRRDRIFIIGRLAQDSMRLGCERGSAVGQYPSFIGHAGAAGCNGKVQRTIADTADYGLQHRTIAGSEGSQVGTLQGQGSDTERHIPAPADGYGWSAADSADAGLESMRRERQDAVHGLGTIADTMRSRGQEMDKHLQSEIADGKESLGNGRKSHAPNPESESSEPTDEREDWLSQQMELGRRSGKDYRLGERWERFPTVSPIHRGDDGLPFPMDGLAIPFNKWRQEALKAYGNAIVPQVVYEIFRAIEEVEQSKSKQS